MLETAVEQVAEQVVEPAEQTADAAVEVAVPAEPAVEPAEVVAPSEPAATKNQAVNPYPDMTLREIAQEFPEFMRASSSLCFLAGLPDSDPNQAIRRMLEVDAPAAAEKLSKFVAPQKYRAILQNAICGINVSKNVFRHVLIDYPELIDDTARRAIMCAKNSELLKMYVAEMLASWSHADLLEIVSILGVEEVSKSVPLGGGFIVYLFGAGARPDIGCQVLSGWRSPVAIMDLLMITGSEAYKHFPGVTSPECWRDPELYKFAVEYSAPSIPETIAGLFAQGVPVTSGLIRDPVFAPFKHYLLACM